MPLTRETRVLAISAPLHLLTHMLTLLFPAVALPVSREFSVPPAEVIAMGFPMYFLYGVLALPAGYLADRWSKIAILKVCAAGMTICVFAAGSSSTLAGFAASLTLLGVFCSLYHPAGLGLISSQIGRQGRAHGTNGVFGNIGIGMAPLFAGAVLMAANWRWVYTACGFLGLAALALIYALEVEEKKGAPAPLAAVGESRAHNAKYFAILLAAMTMAGLIYRANSVALPPLFETSGGGALADAVAYVSDRLGRDAGSGAAAMIVSTLFIFSVAGQIAGGRVADGMDLRHGYIAFHLAAALFIFLVSRSSGMAMYMAAAGMVFFNLGIQPVENSLIASFIPGRWISTGYGIKFTFTFGVGSLAVAQVAWAEETIGLKNLYSIMALEAVAAAGCAVWLLAATRGLARIGASGVQPPAGGKFSG